MIDWLITYGPVNVGISVPPSMMKYKSGVYTPSAYDCKFKVLGLHALLVVGYGQTDDGEKYWIVKNSWGQKWGTEDGYVYFARGKNACGIEDEPIGILA
uniref:Peptidase C1A papain C-terminal domain-containing protein n=1 Tax=Panagrolaimus davidi TaxID=227884 RepID=A0A914PE06_9BILA